MRAAPTVTWMSASCSMTGSSRQHARRRARWELLCLAIGAYLHERTGLAIDFQIQSTTIANERYDGRRNPLGMGRVFAGGGDATPDWDVNPKTEDA